MYENTVKEIRNIARQSKLRNNLIFRTAILRRSLPLHSACASVLLRRNVRRILGPGPRPRPVAVRLLATAIGRRPCMVVGDVGREGTREGLEATLTGLYNLSSGVALPSASLACSSGRVVERRTPMGSTGDARARGGGARPGRIAQVQERRQAWRLRGRGRVDSGSSASRSGGSG